MVGDVNRRGKSFLIKGKEKSRKIPAPQKTRVGLKAPVSVVIATLGSASLSKTLNSVWGGTTRPHVIFLCIPRADAKKISQYACETVKILATKEKGQVAQRVIGFRNAKTPYVLQMDDDVLLHPSCLESLISSLNEKPKSSAVGAYLCWQDSNQPCHKEAWMKQTWWKKIIQNGLGPLNPGKISKSGTTPGALAEAQSAKSVESEWLPGGCVLHRKKYLCLKNYYPFPGKAYSEDVMHSIYLRNRGVRLFLEPKAKAYIERPVPPLKFMVRFREILKQSAARQHVLSLLRLPKNQERIYTALVLISLPWQIMLRHCLRKNQAPRI